MLTLVIYDDPDFGQILGSHAKLALGSEAIYAQNLDAAADALWKWKVGAFSLIICRCNVPANTTTPGDLERSDPTAIKFLRNMYPDAMLPPCIFVATQAQERYIEAMTGMKRAQLLQVMDVPERISTVIQELVNGVKPKRHEHLFDIEISLTGSGQGSYWRLRGKQGSGLTRDGSIIIPQDELDDLLIQSEAVGATRYDAGLTANKMIRRLGRQIYQCIVQDPAHSPGLGEELCSRTSNWDRIDATRLRFEVDDKTSQLLVETLARPRYDGNSEEDLWILRSPVFRCFGARSARLPLYKDEASRKNDIHCLVIQGCSKTFKSVCGDEVKDYRAIDYANEEVNWLSNYLGHDRALFGLATFQVVHESDFPDGGFGKRVRELLVGGNWQLIHYTGHSDIDKAGEGYLVMGPDPEDVISIDEFARTANKAQFVFLNSCLSADPCFIRKLVQRDVPAAAGYAWPVPDQVAKTFCEAFYSELFLQTEDAPSDRGFIEYAYMRAKASLRNAFPNHALWTAPLLYMQTMDGQMSN